MKNYLPIPGGHHFKDSENGRVPTNKVITCINCDKEFWYSVSSKNWVEWQGEKYNGTPSCAFGIMDKVLE